MSIHRPEPRTGNRAKETLIVGILALQGDVEPHQQALARLGIRPNLVRLPQQVEELDALVIPGGESTTMSVLMRRWELYPVLRHSIAQGMAVLGTCAGAILLANRIEDDRHNVVVEPIGGMDFVAVRNAWGRQVDSFEAPVRLSLPGEEKELEITGVFIRAPRFREIGAGVEVVGRLADGEPVVLRQGRLVAAAFHPELTEAPHLHQLLLRLASGQLD